MERNSNKGVIALLIVIIVILGALCVLFATRTISFNTNTTNNNDNHQSNTQNEENNPNKTTNENDNVDENTASSSNTVEQKTSVSKSQILAYYEEHISAFSDSSQQYSISDINNDGIPELFIYVTGTIGSEIIADTKIYTYDENKGDKSNNYIVGIGIISGRYTSFYKMNDGTLMTVDAHMGYESIAHFKLENDWLVRMDFSSKQTDNYSSGDTEIIFKQCSDSSLIDDFDN